MGEEGENRRERERGKVTNILSSYLVSMTMYSQGP